jgi:hypothetical protein
MISSLKSIDKRGVSLLSTKILPLNFSQNTTYSEKYFVVSLKVYSDDDEEEDVLLERAGDDGEDKEVVAIVILPSTTHFAPPNSLPPGP